MVSEVCVITVTYGNRTQYLSQVLDEVVRQGVNEIIIVDNNSENKSKKQLKRFKTGLKNKIKIISFNTNIGSAGFSLGLKYAHKYSQCDYFWILDDDNLPEKNSLQKLVSLWKKIKIESNYQNVIISCHRKGKKTVRKAIFNNNPELTLGTKNSFRNFNIINFVSQFIQKTLKINKYYYYSNKSYGKIFVAPYGGMFFHKSILDLIGFPNDQFFLYFDDHEFSHRLIHKGGMIYLSLESVIKDIERPFWKKPKNRILAKIVVRNRSRLYYSTRNRIIFEKKNLVTNRLLYGLNILLYVLFLFLIALIYLKFEYVTIYIEAIADGLAFRLGKKKSYPLNV